MFANAARREIHDLHQRAFELGFVDVARAVQVDIDRQRLGDADRIGKLKGAAIAQSRGDDVLGEIARGVGRRAVDLGRILAREGAAAVRRRAAVGVDDDLASREAAIAVGPADIELARRIDVPDGLGGDPAFRQRRGHIRANDRSDVLGAEVRVDMLMGNDDLRRLDRLAVFVAHRHLALGVGAERLFPARMARLGNEAKDLVRVLNWRRHEFRGLAAGVAEHDALVAGAFVLVAGRVDALRDIGGLGVQQHFHLARCANESLPARSRFP